MKKLFSIFAIIILMSGCSKEELPKGATIDTTSSVVLKDNAHIIDSTKFKLNTSPTLLSQGIYQFTGDVSKGKYNVNDVIVGLTQDGYIRKVTGITQTPNSITYTTTQATLGDVIKKGDIHFKMSSDSLISQGTNPIDNNKSSRLNNDGVSKIIDFSEKGLTVKGSVDFNPNWDFDLKYEEGELKLLKLSCDNATLIGKLNVVLASASGINSSGSKTLAEYSKYSVVKAGYLPVLVKMKVKLMGNYSLNIKESQQKEFTYTSTNTVNLGIIYDNGMWSNKLELKTKDELDAPPTKSSANLGVKFAIVPEVNFEFYGLGGPYSSLGLNTSLVGNLNTSTQDWDLTAKGWLQTTLGARIGVLGYKKDYKYTFDNDSVVYNTPDTISVFSGDNQCGKPGNYLISPIEVLVADSKGRPQPNVPVYFEVSQGGGSVDNKKVMTDVDGFASTKWKLGNMGGLQKVKVEARMADGTPIPKKENTLEFKANNDKRRVNVGDTLQGGIVFYVDEYCGSSGLICSSIDIGNAPFDYDYHYYRAAEKANDTRYWDIFFKLSSAGTDTTYRPLPTGKEATRYIIEALGDKHKDIATYLCHALVLNGYDDWYLPSLAELKFIRKNLYHKGIGNIEGIYWSSSLSQYIVHIGGYRYPGYWFAEALNFKTGGLYFNYSETETGESVKFKVRAVRAFSL